MLVNHDQPKRSNLTIPNVLSSLRLAAVPGLLWLAWAGWSRAYLIAFCVVYATDFLDGQLARRLHQETELGATLDQVADVAALLTLPVAMAWNWPAILQRELAWLVTLIGLYGASVVVSWLKFRRVATTHAWFGKTSSCTLAIGAIIALLGWADWPFRLGLIMACLACLEEIAITLTLRAPRSNVPTLWHAWDLRMSERAHLTPPAGGGHADPEASPAKGQSQFPDRSHP